MYKNKKCVICGNEFTPNGPSQKYCKSCVESNTVKSYKDKQPDTNKNITINCYICGKPFKRTASQIKIRQHHCCSKECSKQLQRKVEYEHMSEHVGMDFKKWLIQKYVIEELSTIEISGVLGNKAYSKVSEWMKRLHIPRRSLSKARTTKRMADKICGPNNPNYNPNLTDEERVQNRDTMDNIKWRESVYKRDNYTCQCCKYKRGGNLIAHHLDGYDTHPKGRQDVSNGITLCEKCHKEFHHLYGYGHNTKEQYKQFVKYKKSKNHNGIQLALII